MVITWCFDEKKPDLMMIYGGEWELNGGLMMIYDVS